MGSMVSIVPIVMKNRECCVTLVTDHLEITGLLENVRSERGTPKMFRDE